MATYKVGNWPMATTAAPVPVATGTAIKTMLQVQAASTRPLQIVGWGCSFNASALATPGVVELVHTGTIAATVTAHSASGVQPYADPNSPASLVQLGTAGTGFTATAEGSITTTRSLDERQIDPVNTFDWLFLPDRRPMVPASGIVRVRVTMPTTANMLTYIIFDE